MDCDIIPFMTPKQFFHYEKTVSADASVRRALFFKIKNHEVREIISMYGEKGLEELTKKGGKND